MSDRPDDLARSHGIQTRYTSEHDEPTDISDEAKRALLKVLNVDPQTGATGDFANEQHEATRRCALPTRKRDRRVWGLTCQLYGLRSSRNLGIGDFRKSGDHALGIGHETRGSPPSCRSVALMEPEASI